MGDKGLGINDEKYKFYNHQYDTYKKFILSKEMREKYMDGKCTFKNLLEEMDKQAEPKDNESTVSNA